MVVLAKERFKVKMYMCVCWNMIIVSLIVSLANWKDMDMMGWKDYGVQDVSCMVFPPLSIHI